MMTIRSFFQAILFCLFLVTITFSVFELSGVPDSLSHLKRNAAPFLRPKEEFDPSLSRINSMDKLEMYVDSLYKEGLFDKQNQSIYPAIAEGVVRKKFYHGYSYYGVGNNYVASILSPFTGKVMDAIVIPDDILEHPYAACSQQCIVLMSLLKRKGYQYRAIGFSGKKYGGHYCCELKYNGTWHFYDPNMEPDDKLLASKNWPSIDQISSNNTLLLSTYKNWEAQKVLGIFKTYTYKKPNASLAPYAAFYQYLTKFLSYTIWIFFLGAFAWVRKYNHSSAVIKRQPTAPYGWQGKELQPGI